MEDKVILFISKGNLMERLSYCNGFVFLGKGGLARDGGVFQS